MDFTVEVLLKGTDEVVTETVTYDGVGAAGWTDGDVREMRLATLRIFERVSAGENAACEVLLRGLSWIVTPTNLGMMIAIEIPSGAIAAGPFDLPADELTQMVTRVISAGRQTREVH